MGPGSGPGWGPVVISGWGWTGVLIQGKNNSTRHQSSAIVEKRKHKTQYEDFAFNFIKENFKTLKIVKNFYSCNYF